VYVLAVESTPVLVLPLADLLPLQSPLAVQDVGLLATLQLTVAALPVPIVVGLTAIVTAGFVVVLVEDTVSPVLAVLLPPAFEQVKV
jgi:hypothetical protein